MSSARQRARERLLREILEDYAIFVYAREREENRAFKLALNKKKTKEARLGNSRKMKFFKADNNSKMCSLTHYNVRLHILIRTS